MKVVLFGPPGAGKGTQACEISAYYGLTHISTGDLIRKNIREKTPIGLVALDYIERGKLAPDEVVMQLLDKEIAGLDGYLLDGFPRTLVQAKMLDEITDIDVVINLQLDDELVVSRIVNRMVCPVCGRSYNKLLHSTTVCDCGATLTMRTDDTPEIVEERLKVYREQTLPILDYYGAIGKVKNIDGNGSVGEVFGKIKKALYDYDKKR